MKDERPNTHLIRSLLLSRNPAVESQAVDRIHRLGQTKPVDVVRFIIKVTHSLCSFI